jgi:broad specificity phosphatase PhoE
MRHAETVWNAPRRRIQGQLPSSEIILSERGRKETIDKMALVKIPDLLICSPLLRCKQTAEIWFGVGFEEIKLSKLLMDELKEINVGSLESQYVDELAGKNKEIWGSWKTNPLTFPGFPGGETPTVFHNRIMAAFSKICTDYLEKYQEIFIICHGGPMRVLRCFLENQDLSHFWDKDILPLERIELTDETITSLKKIARRTC